MAWLERPSAIRADLLFAPRQRHQAVGAAVPPHDGVHYLGVDDDAAGRHVANRLRQGGAPGNPFSFSR